MLRNKWGRYLQAHELYPLLGLRPGEHLPRDGFGPRRVGGEIFRCEPADRGNKSHRVKFLCDCGNWIPFGRAGQHIPACPGEPNEAEAGATAT